MNRQLKLVCGSIELGTSETKRELEVKGTHSAYKRHCVKIRTLNFLAQRQNVGNRHIAII